MFKTNVGGIDRIARIAVFIGAGLAGFGGMLIGIDTSIDPGDDFFAYANSKWLNANPLPPEFSRYGAFTLLAEKSTLQRLLRRLDAHELRATLQFAVMALVILPVLLTVFGLAGVSQRFVVWSLGLMLVALVLYTQEVLQMSAMQYGLLLTAAATLYKVLIDGVELARLMVENNLGVSVKQVYEVKQLDSDYFAED